MKRGYFAERPMLIIVDGQIRAEARPDPGSRARPHVLHRPIQPIPVGQGEEVSAGGRAWSTRASGMVTP